MSVIKKKYGSCGARCFPSDDNAKQDSEYAPDQKPKKLCGSPVYLFGQKQEQGEAVQLRMCALALTQCASTVGGQSITKAIKQSWRGTFSHCQWPSRVRLQVLVEDAKGVLYEVPSVSSYNNKTKTQ